MKVSDYIVDFLVKAEVKDVFGIPGGVVLDFLDSVGKRKRDITAHLNYNEQASVFAACGYAQASGKLAVAYATRGPGIANMITGIIDAFCDSLPVLFITAHSHRAVLSDIRVEENQEFNTIKMLSSVTKYAVSIEDVKNLRFELEKAYYIAITGRPGPVLIDIWTNVLLENINTDVLRPYMQECPNNDASCVTNAINCIKGALRQSKRPIFLVGDGVRLSSTINLMKELSQKLSVPVLSSRSAQDALSGFCNYFGYIGSHGTRWGNFILSKCDLVIAVGNRLAFNPDSKSFGPITNRAKIIRIDIDKNEFSRDIPNSECFVADLKEFMPLFNSSGVEWHDSSEWISVCKELRKNLSYCDISMPVNIISKIMQTINPQTIVSDVGNNEFLVSRAYVLACVSSRLLYSKSFGALGCSLPKAIGAYYSTRNEVLCFMGDQGLQMNLQELQFIVSKQLPVTIVVLNNRASGMIYDDQKRRFDSRFESTTLDSGYSVPSFKKLATAFGIKFFTYNGKGNLEHLLNEIVRVDKPLIVEVILDKDISKLSYLPKGNPMQKMEPMIDSDLYKRLEKL